MLECGPLTAWVFLMSSLEEFEAYISMENAKLCKLTLMMAETAHAYSISTI